MTIANALENHKYKIAKINGQTKDRRRLLDMGLTPNTFVIVHKFAPFKSAVLVSLRGTMLALRMDVARIIEIVEAL